MKKVFPVLIFVTLTAFTALVFMRAEQQTVLSSLAATYFSPVPANGYGTERALTAAQPEAASSFLHQGVVYHQQERYDFALVSLRAYLDDVPVQTDYRPTLLAATAAYASGQYAEAGELLEAMPQEEQAARAAYHWYSGLLALRNNEAAPANTHLEALAKIQPHDYPLAELTARWAAS